MIALDVRSTVGAAGQRVPNAILLGVGFGPSAAPTLSFVARLAEFSTWWKSRRHLSRSAVAIVPPTDLWGCLQLSGTDGKDIMAHLMRKFSGFKRERSRVLKEG